MVGRAAVVGLRYNWLAAFPKKMMGTVRVCPWRAIVASIHTDEGNTVMLKVYNNASISRDRGAMSRRGGILQGCLIAVAIVLVLVIAGGIFVYMNARGWSASLMQTVAVEAVNQSDLPESEKPEIIAVFDDLSESFRSGDVTLEELIEVFTDLDKTPVFALGTVLQFEGAYVGKSGLTDEQKAAAKLTLNRVAQGLADNRLSWDQATAILKPVTVKDANGDDDLLMPDETNDEQIREVIANAEAAVTEAGITDAYKEIDLSEEFRKHIEARLGRTIGSAGAAADSDKADD
jgi:hypothetical protein